jgi:hypothetical protein
MPVRCAANSSSTKYVAVWVTVKKSVSEDKGNVTRSVLEVAVWPAEAR